MDLGSQNATFTDNVGSLVTGPVDIKQNIQVVKLGVNFHVFAGQGLAPIRVTSTTSRRNGASNGAKRTTLTHATPDKA